MGKKEAREDDRIYIGFTETWTVAEMYRVGSVSVGTLRRLFPKMPEDVDGAVSFLDNLQHPLDADLFERLQAENGDNWVALQDLMREIHNEVQNLIREKWINPDQQLVFSRSADKVADWPHIDRMTLSLVRHDEVVSSTTRPTRDDGGLINICYARQAEGWEYYDVGTVSMETLRKVFPVMPEDRAEAIRFLEQLQKEGGDVWSRVKDLLGERAEDDQPFREKEWEGPGSFFSFGEPRDRTSSRLDEEFLSLLSEDALVAISSLADPCNAASDVSGPVRRSTRRS